jgi:hypothetical protein
LNLECASSPSTDGYQSSPLLNVALESGVTYAIGGYWETSPVAYPYLTTTTVNFPLAVSLGSLTGGMSVAVPVTTTSLSPTSSVLYYPQRLSTR